MINDTDGRKAWICPVCHRISYCLGWHCAECANLGERPADEIRMLALTEIAAINARQAEEVEALNEKPTPAQLNDACMSYRHDFGLLAKDDADQTMGEALDWWTAIVRALKRG